MDAVLHAPASAQIARVDPDLAKSIGDARELSEMLALLGAAQVAARQA
jgi:hypothetical protein